MKTSIPIILTTVCVSGLLLSASAQPTTGGTAAQNGAATTPDQSVSPANGTDMNNTNTSPPDATQGQTAQNQGAMNGQETAQPAEAAPAGNQPIESTVILPKGNAPEAVPSAFAPPAQAIGTNDSNELRLNFRNAPLEMVLNYLSDAAGFIIVLDTHVNGNVTIVSTHPVSQDEAVNLLNTELNRNNYAAIRNGRTLTIVDKNDAKTRNIPVKTGNNPGSIPDNDEIATWIIPIRFVEARQLVSDLSAFVSPQATIVANEAGNSIVVTDTQSNIRHLAEIIQSVDNSAETETEIRVFRLKYASPADVASELSSVFPSSTSGNNTQSPIQFRGGGGGPGGFFARMMAASAGGNNSLNQRIQKATQVTAVADSRIQAVIVTAPKDLMEQIASMMTDLDVASDRDQDVSVISLQNGDPQQVVQVLQNMFQSSNTSRSSTSSSQNSALQQRAQTSTTTMGAATTTTTSGIGGTGYGAGGATGGRQF
jgi:type II secretory pathway component GspD/PulD (secretin)